MCFSSARAEAHSTQVFKIAILGVFKIGLLGDASWVWWTSPRQEAGKERLQSMLARDGRSLTEHVAHELRLTLAAS